MQRRTYRAAITAVLFTLASAASATDFMIQDEFNRPDGAVGRDWINSPDNTSGCQLVIQKDALASPSPSCQVGIYRPFTLQRGDVVTFSADTTQKNGFGGLKQSFGTEFSFNSTGSINSGYGIYIGRGDQHYPSTVNLILNNAVLETQTSSVSYTDIVHVTGTLYPDGSIVGYLTSKKAPVQIFSFAARDFSAATGNNFLVRLDGADSRSSVIIVPTVDNLKLEVR